MDVKQDIPGKPLKVIDLTTKKFTANGKTFNVETSMSFERYRVYQKLEIQLGYQAGFYGLFEDIKKIYALCNDSKVADIAVLSHNILSGIKTVDERTLPALEMCALFINEDSEDRKTINDDMISAKIADWEAEGLDIVPFFQLAVNSIPGFSIAFNSVSQIISNLTPTQVKKNLSKKKK